MQITPIDSIDSDLIFLLTMDGVHCPIQEPSPWSKVWSSHKLGGDAAVSYKISLRIDKPQLLSVNGPFPAGTSDIDIFRNRLKALIPAQKRAIGDDGYKGEPNVISTANEFDCREVCQFKNRALARQESFNSLIKNFDCLRMKFRHGVNNHQVVCEAVCAIVMYKIASNDATLFDAYP